MAGESKEISVSESNEVNNWNTHLIDPEKKDAEWGKQVFLSSKTLMRPAFGGYYGGYNNYDAELIRQFAVGNQPIERYQVVFDPQDKEFEYMGLNWDIAPIIPQIRNRVLGDLNIQPTKVQCYAIDELANNEKNKDRLRLKAQAILDKKLKQFSDKMAYDTPIKSGFDKNILSAPQNSSLGVTDMNFDLENDEELGILMSSGYYSPKYEMAQEFIQKAIFNYNRFDDMSHLLKEDIVDYGVCAHRVYVDNFTGLPMYQYMYPYKVYINRSRFKDYHDATMWYYRPPATLSDVLEQFGDEIDEQEAKDIWEKSVHRSASSFPSYNVYGGDWRRWNNGDLRKIEVDLYYFELKTQDAVAYEVSQTKSGTEKRKKKSVSYNADESKGKKKETYWAECVYKGYYIEGISKVYSWGKLKNMPRELGREQFTSFSLIMNRMSDKGLTEQVISYADRYQESYLHLQHAIVKSLPRGYSFNWDALSEINLGDGGKITQLDLIKMYTQTGSTIHRTRDENGDPLPLTQNGSQPHMLMENGLDPNVKFFLDIMNAMSEKIALTYGINPTQDAINPNPKTGLGVSQQAKQASYNARHFLYYGMQQVIIQTATLTSIMVADIAKYNKYSWDKIKQMVGAYNSAIIESMDDVIQHRYSFYFKNEPTDQEMAEFKQDLMVAYQSGQIQLPDLLAIQFLDGDNLKQSIMLLQLKITKNSKAAMQMKQQELAAPMQALQMKAQIDMALQKLKNDGVIENSQIVGKFALLEEKMKQQGDLQKKTLLEVMKINFKKEEMENAKEQMDKEFQNEAMLMEEEKMNKHETIHEQKEADIEYEKSKPKPKVNAT